MIASVVSRLPKECSRHCTQVSDLPPRDSQVWNTGKSHASPDREATTGYSLSRQGHPTIAHRFSGGTTPPVTPPGFRRRLSSLTGLDGLVGIAFPPLKRWATVGCHSRDKDGSFLWKQGLGSRAPARWKSCSKLTGFCVEWRLHSFRSLRRLRKSDGQETLHIEDFASQLNGGAWPVRFGTFCNENLRPGNSSSRELAFRGRIPLVRPPVCRVVAGGEELPCANGFA